MTPHRFSAVTLAESDLTADKVAPDSTGARPAERLHPLSDLALSRGPRFSGATLAALATLAGALAIAAGSWAFAYTVTDSDDVVAALRPPVERRHVSLLAKAGTERVPLSGSVGRIVLAVDTRGKALLVLDGLGPAPAGKGYQAWVVAPEYGVPLSAAAFDGTRMLVPLSRRVPRGATVAVTLERAGGASAPTRTPRLLARRS